ADAAKPDAAKPGADQSGAAAARRLAAALTQLADATAERRAAAQTAFVMPLRVALGALEGYRAAAEVTQDTLPDNLLRQRAAPDGKVRVQALPKRDPNDNDTLRHFASAIQPRFPDAVGTPVSILESGNTIIMAFLHAGIFALISIAILLWLVLRR